MSPSMSDNGQERDQSDIDLRVKKTRASKPKVKTGCQTCKIRRVKCDETKPNCLRCVRFGHQCDGYSNKTPSSSSSTKSSRTLQPKSPVGNETFRSEAAGSRTYQSPPPAQLCIAPRPVLFDSSFEHQAFYNFCSRTAQQVSSAFTSDVWTRLMYQAWQTSPAVRQAVIAMGSMEVGSSPCWPESLVGTLKHQSAFRQYSRASCLMRRDIAGSYCDLRTTLMACLLFHCYESYHGSHELAINQVYSGIKLIREWTIAFYQPDENGNLRMRIGGESPYLSEEDLLRAFGVLEIHVMTFADSRARGSHEYYRRSDQAAIDDIPSIFRSLEESRIKLELVIQRSMHWLRSTMHPQNFSTPGSSPTSSTSSETEDFGPYALFFDIDPTYEERMETMNEYERWDQAFKPLLNCSRSRSAPHSDFLLASTLRLHWLAGYMSIASNNSYSSLVNNTNFTTELEELVDIAQMLLNQPEEIQNSAFVFDMQILVPLLTVGWNYGHRALRREAINLLLRCPRKEGAWDGVVLGRVMQWLASIEEEACRGEPEERGKADCVPECATVRGVLMDFDASTRQAKVSCLQPVRGRSGLEEMKREAVIPW